jgi:hypothetical protein
MFESFASQSKTTPAEWLLARLTDPARAAAILGDLTELSTTRGRLWFWTTYTRTLIMIVSMRLLFRTLVPWIAHSFWLSHRAIHQWTNPGLFGEENRHVSMVLWNISLVIAQCLCFVLPYVAVRFGLRDRLTQLACALFLLALPVYCFSSEVRDLSGILTVIAIVAAIVIAPWRRPLLVLAATCVTAIAIKVVSTFGLALVSQRYFFRLSSPTIGDAIAFAVGSAVCLHLHRLLLRRSPAIA